VKAYYAHCKSLYETPQEARDIAMLEKLGFEVVNPNSKAVREEFERWRETYGHDVSYDPMDFFRGLAAECDVVVFRALPDGRISAGVAEELNAAVGKGVPVLELLRGLSWRAMSVSQTREYLCEIGQR